MKRLLMSLIAVGTGLGSLPGCGGVDGLQQVAVTEGPVSQVAKQEVCAGSSVVPVNSYAGQFGVPVHFVQHRKSPVGRLVMTNYSSCSGVLISCDLFLTAAHCVDGTTSNFGTTSAAPSHVVFNDEAPGPNGVAETPVTYWVDTSVKASNAKFPGVVEHGVGADYALIKLMPRDLTGYGWYQWACETNAVSNLAISSRPSGDRGTIIQHPGGRSREVHAGLLTSNGGVHEFAIDIENGSSGSGVLNQLGEVIGLANYGGCTVQGFNSGTSMFAIRQASPWIAAYTHDVHHADFKGSGWDDQLIRRANRPNGAGGISHSITLKYTTGGTWQNASYSFCTGEFDKFMVGDVNLDGRADIICHNALSGSVAIDYATSSGQFGGQDVVTNIGFCTGGSEYLEVADFNADGRVDLLCHDKSNGNVKIALASTSGTYTSVSHSYTAGFCTNGRLYVGDFDGNGRADLLCHRPTDGFMWMSLSSAAVPAGNAVHWSGATNFCVGTLRDLVIGRWNNDSYADVLCHRHPTGQIQIANAFGFQHFGTSFWNAFSKGFAPTQYSHNNRCGLQGNGLMRKFRFPGDSLDDLICHAPDALGGTVVVADNMGNQF